MLTLFSENHDVHGSLKAAGSRSSAQPSCCATDKNNKLKSLTALCKITYMNTAKQKLLIFSQISFTATLHQNIDDRNYNSD